MPRDNIILIGFMGSGKSSIGRLIKTQTGRRFVDTDQLIVQETGREIAELFKTEGEPAFRERERLALKSLLGSNHLVVATGGGIVTRPENIHLLQELGFVVWLTAKEEVIFDRVSRNNKRPLLHTPDPRATISNLLLQRNPLYKQAAQFRIDTSNLQLAPVAQTICAAAEQHFSSGA